MARIQVLELPTLVEGDRVTTPFVLVIDQAEPQTATRQSILGPVSVSQPVVTDDFERAAKAAGATAVIVSTQTLDVVQR